jgi:hypothetical protein
MRVILCEEEKPGALSLLRCLPLLAVLLLAACEQEAAVPPIEGPAELVEPGANRQSCALVRGTVYRSDAERAWFLANCLQGAPAQAANRASCDVIRGTAFLSIVEQAWFQANCPGPDVIPDRACHPSYENACLATDLGDYDCDGRGEDGPNFVRGRLRVVGPDVFALDRDGNGVACE